jgi:ethanolamine-phosphate phospho-lyase
VQGQHLDYMTVLAKRKKHIGPNTTLVYKQPLHMVRGVGCRLYDADGNEYLDCVNNVAHVGHCHPKVRPYTVRTCALCLQRP